MTILPSGPPKFGVTTLNSACVGVRCQGWGDWMAAAGELTSNMKVKWQAGHSKVSVGVSHFQTSQEQSGRKRPSQLLADVSGCMFLRQTRGRRRSPMVPLVTSNLHLAGVKAATLQSGLVFVISDIQLNWLWPVTGYFDRSPDRSHI